VPQAPGIGLCAAVAHARAQTRCGAQALYPAVPLALAPALGNPILLAAFGVDASAPLAQQARWPPSRAPER